MVFDLKPLCFYRGAFVYSGNQNHHMSFKSKLDDIYNDVVKRLENFQSSHPRGSLKRLTEYFHSFGETMKELAEKFSKGAHDLIEKYPDKKEEIINYIKELKNKLISTYRPK